MESPQISKQAGDTMRREFGGLLGAVLFKAFLIFVVLAPAAGVSYAFYLTIRGIKETWPGVFSSASEAAVVVASFLIAVILMFLIAAAAGVGFAMAFRLVSRFTPYFQLGKGREAIFVTLEETLQDPSLPPESRDRLDAQLRDLRQLWK